MTMDLTLPHRPGFLVLSGHKEDAEPRAKKLAASLWGKVVVESCGPVTLIAGCPGAYTRIVRWDGGVGIINGYAGVLSRADESLREERPFGSEQCLEKIGAGKWPLSADYTGSFVAVVVNPEAHSLTLCNDPIGPYPLYYSEKNGQLTASTSLLLLSRFTGEEPDPVGVIESLPYPFVTYGRRTLAKNIQRLLPGEARTYKEGRFVKTSFDTTLYKNVHGVQQKEAVAHYIDALTKEITIATGPAKRCHIGLSGGVDSRLLLGLSLNGGFRTACHTIGAHHDYETVLARRVARAAGVAHFVYPLDRWYFPDRATFQRVVSASEAVPYLQWIPVLEWNQGFQRSKFYIGDLCEAAAGRTVKISGGRWGRAVSAIRGMWGIPSRLTRSSPSALAEWSELQIGSLLNDMLREAKRGLIEPVTQGVIEEIRRDLEESIEVILRHEPEYVELCDELLTWYHYIRIMAFSQILLLDCLFDAACPPMGIGPMRIITGVDPHARTLQRFMDRILREWPHQRLSEIPTANAPLFGANAPSLLRDLSWCTRWVIDQGLQRLYVKTRGRSGFRRAVPSTDYQALYLAANVDEVSGWFIGQFLQREHYVERFLKRRRGERWPLINNTIAGPAAIEALATNIAMTRH